MPTKKIEQALALIEKVESLLKDAKQELSPLATEDNFLDVPDWPQAVNPNLICELDNEKEKEERANGIVELMIEENLDGKKFLDFGCGEGHVAEVASRHNTSLSIGYDIVNNENWSKRNGDNLEYTTHLNVVTSNAPYDVILLFDVLDHVAPYDNLSAPQRVLGGVADILSPGGKIYLRCHPWTSRHATHVYHWLNKAYVHLIYTNEELENMGVNPGETTQKVVKPVATYRQWIQESGLEVDNERIVKEPVEEFFKSPKFSEKILKNVGKYGFSEGFPEFQMSVQFIDYIASKK